MYCVNRNSKWQLLPTCVISEADDPYSENCPITIRCLPSHYGIRVANLKTPRRCPRMLDVK